MESNTVTLELEYKFWYSICELPIGHGQEIQQASNQFDSPSNQSKINWLELDQDGTLLPHSSLPQDSFRNCRSSLAIRRFVPHLDCTASKTCFCISFFCGPASHTIAMNIGEQSKRLASFQRLQVIGSLNRSLRISSMSEGFKWYLFSTDVSWKRHEGFSEHHREGGISWVYGIPRGRSKAGCEWFDHEIGWTKHQTTHLVWHVGVVSSAYTRIDAGVFAKWSTDTKTEQMTAGLETAVWGQ